MQLDEFKIGESFWTGSGEWICIDVGSRVIVAVHKEEVDQYYADRSLTMRQIDPLIFNETVFNDFDIKGCYKSKDEYNQLVGED